MSEQSKEYKINGRDSTIFRVKKSPDNPYVTIDRRPINNPKLSFKAKGILTYLLSRPDGWEVNVPDLVNHGTDGPAAIRAGLKELRDCGHIRYNQEREGGYIRRWVIEVYEVPEVKAHSDEGEKVLDCDFLQVGNLQVENRGEVLSTLSIKELNDKVALLAKLYQSEVGPLTALTAEMLRNAAITYPQDWYAPAFEISVKNNARNWTYIETVLENWRKHGREWTPEKKHANSNGHYPGSAKGQNSQPVSAAPSPSDERVAAEVLAEQAALFSL